MKKIVSLILIVTAVLSLCACGSKVAPSPDSFISVAESHGYEVTDQTANADPAEYALFYVVDNDDVMIQFVQTADADHARELYDSIYESVHEQASVSTNTQVNNHGRAQLTVGDTFCLMAFVDNTMLYSEFPKSDKEEMKTIADDLGF